MDSNELRRAFTGFFNERGHKVLPSASLIPADPTLLFTVAGMVPFKPWFLGDEQSPFSRATSVQKCLRAGGKHNDLDAIGTTNRHLTFFEMLGNFSFGDYFKAEAIPFAWEFTTEVLGFDPDRVWITVHDTDDEAAEIWLDQVGIDPSRFQRMGEDNWWQMGDTGPCGPCSELYFDKGDHYGDPGGPAHGGPERFVEFWNLVFMQFNRTAKGELTDLPKRNIDTGAGFERILTLLQGTDSVFDTDVLRPILAGAEELTAKRYGAGGRDDVALRIMADHARAMAFMVADGIFPTNEGRGYVLRRIIRRAVLRASQLGVDKDVTPTLIGHVVDVMGEAYPALAGASGFIQEVVSREEDAFRSTLRAGAGLLDEALERHPGTVPGEIAFRLHDTYGFPIDLTREIASERGATLDQEGFDAAMAAQRDASRAAAGGGKAGARTEQYRALMEQFGTTSFVGYEDDVATARILAVLPGADPATGGEARSGEVEVFLDTTPFYAEGGGQVGDTGTIEGPGLAMVVLDTTAPLPGLHRHRAVIKEGDAVLGATVTARIDGARREAIKRNHTGTHLLHWALREVLGSHVRQHGSLVAPERLRFDFSHHSAPTPAELAEVEDLVNAVVLASEEVKTESTTKAEAEERGAIAFFGDRYGETVRMVAAGSASLELCGGTHVASTGMIGPLRIVSESSIGSNTRRIEAVTGEASLARWRKETEILAKAAGLVQAPADELLERIEDLRESLRQARDELKTARSSALRNQAATLAGAAEQSMVVVRQDGWPGEELRELALAIRSHPGVEAAVVVGSPDGQGVSLVAAVRPNSGLVASELLAPAAKLVGGGGGRGPEVAVAGGRFAAKIDEALELIRAALGLAAAPQNA